MSVLDRIKSWFEPYHPLSPGIYHYQTPPDAAQQYRLHLRVEGDGHGVLLINAARVLHLNQTATEHAKLFIEGQTAEEAAREISRRYNVAVETARA
ncbi:MAG: hypothetical protein PVJ34_13310, partial [Anaerolineae bacterium]